MPVMIRVRIKICGITRPEDAIIAASCGADAIGLVFYKDSPRCIDLEAAARVINSLPPFITKVGVFVEPEEAEVRTVLKHVSLDLLQFHGNESPEFCRRFDRPYIKAVRMREDVDLTADSKRYSEAAALLLDSHVAGIPGGTGRVFDWNLIPVDLDKPVILAGGLEPGNVGEAIARINPYAVDVSGGVEAEKGVKDKQKIEAFIRAVNNARENGN